MTYWPFFVALKLFNRDKTKVLLILTIGMGTIALITVLSIMNGFQNTTRDSILNVDSYHLTIFNDWDASKRQQVIEAIDKYQQVVVIAPFFEMNTFVHNPYGDSVTMRVRGISSSVLQNDQSLLHALNIPTDGFALGASEILIGTDIAFRLQVQVGDTVQLYTYSGNLLAFTIRNIFNSSYTEFNNSLAFINASAVSQIIHSTPPYHIGIKLIDKHSARSFAQTLNAHGIVTAAEYTRIRSWWEINKELFGALLIEKLFMIMLLAMIFVIVAINIYQSIRKKIIKNYHEISLMMSLGGVHKHIVALFLWIGCGVGVCGGAIGVFIGLLVTKNINMLFSVFNRLINGTILFLNYLYAAVINSEQILLRTIPQEYFFFINIPNFVIIQEVIAIYLAAVIISIGATVIACRPIRSIIPSATLGRY